MWPKISIFFVFSQFCLITCWKLLAFYYSEAIFFKISTRKDALKIPFDSDVTFPGTKNYDAFFQQTKANTQKEQSIDQTRKFYCRNYTINYSCIMKLIYSEHDWWNSFICHHYCYIYYFDKIFIAALYFLCIPTHLMQHWIECKSINLTL